MGHRIVISLSGEGRGHAARVLTVVEMLARSHEVLILAPKPLIHFLRSAVAPWDSVSLRTLPGLNFRYDRSGKLSYVRSILAGLPFLVNLGRTINNVSQWVADFAPQLAIIDFEPLLARVARRLKVPSISLDHQHFLDTLEPSSLPTTLRRKLRFLRPSVRLFCPHADWHLVSSFYRYPQRAGTDRYQQVGVLLRKELRDASPSQGNHLLVYVRNGPSNPWIEALRDLRMPTRIYGVDREGTDDHLHYCRISSQKFLDDLIDCRALVTTAGNQLIGEALALRKPVLAVPELGNFEQQLNGFFLSHNQLGETLSPNQFNAQRVAAFLERADGLREKLVDYDGVGNDRVLASIERGLNLVPSVHPRAREPLPLLLEEVVS